MIEFKQSIVTAVRHMQTQRLEIAQLRGEALKSLEELSNRDGVISFAGALAKDFKKSNIED